MRCAPQLRTTSVLTWPAKCPQVMDMSDSRAGSRVQKLGMQTPPRFSLVIAAIEFGSKSTKPFDVVQVGPLTLKASQVDAEVAALAWIVGPGSSFFSACGGQSTSLVTARALGSASSRCHPHRRSLHSLLAFDDLGKEVIRQVSDLVQVSAGGTYVVDVGFKALNTSFKLAVNVSKRYKSAQQRVEQEDVSRVLDGPAEHAKKVEVTPAGANPDPKRKKSCPPACVCGERGKGQGLNLTSPTVGAPLQDSTPRNYPDITGCVSPRSYDSARSTLNSLSILVVEIWYHRVNAARARSADTRKERQRMDQWTTKDE
ncbi:hypothetical protein PSPO01_03095 [Paraphaeosphaeria sporulosa]